MNLDEKKVKSNLLYDGRIIKLYNDQILLPNEKTAFREYVKHPGGVCVVPITEENEILLVRQYRYPYSKQVVEIPAGKRDSAFEDTLEGGKRELKEELGVEAKNFVFLGEFYPTPGYTDEVIYMYAATGLSFSESSPDEDEFVKAEKYPLDILVQMIMSGQIKDGKTQAAVLKVKYLKDKGLL
ncbi:MAG: NUDIX hydrolase [Ruminococcaceae bacterium]|nr:NUDIX hydrolase [Oscillospiraceae bacterium]